MAKNNSGRQEYQGPITQQQQQLQKEQSALEAALEEQRALEGLDESHDIDQNQAAHLQPNMGNQAVQDLLSRLKNVNDAITELEMDQHFDEDLDEDMDLEEELQGQSFGGGSGGGGGGSSENPWELEFFHGGDDDDDNSVKRRNRIKKRRSVGPIMESEDKQGDASPIHEEDMASIVNALPTPEQGERKGDAVYQTVELALKNPMEMSAQSLDPNDLKDRKGASDPIRTPIEIGRFLAEHADSDLASSLGELVGKPHFSLVAPQGGFSTAVARLATLAICSQAALGGGISADQAVSLSLRRETWTEAVNIARRLAQKGQLHAPAICKAALQSNTLEKETRLPPPHPLGGEALKKILPAEIAIPPPYLAIPEPQKEEDDDLLRNIDRLLNEETGGSDLIKRNTKGIDRNALKPALSATNTLLGALGRSQVELAAAAIAVKRINPASNVNATLKHADTALRQLAQAAISSGRGLEKLTNSTSGNAKHLAEKHIAILNSTIAAFKATKHWGFATLAGAMEAVNV